MLSVKLLASSQLSQPMIEKTPKILHVFFQITPTNVNTGANANPYIAGGDVLDLTQLFNTASSAPGMSLPTFDNPILVRILSTRPLLGTGYAGKFEYQYAPSTAPNNGTMQVFTGAAAQAALTEMTAGNYVANVLNDTIIGEAFFAVP